jgi:hypothetical protein
MRISDRFVIGKSSIDAHLQGILLRVQYSINVFVYEVTPPSDLENDVSISTGLFCSALTLQLPSCVEGIVGTLECKYSSIESIRITVAIQLAHSKS